MIEEKKLPERTKTAKPRTEQILQCLTAEHAALQTARASAVADGNSRVYIFLFAVIGAVIALSFIGQFSGVEQTPAANSNRASSATPAQIPGINNANANTATTTATPAAPLSNAAAMFFWFGIVLFPALFFLGLTTFIRALQTAMEDVVHARGIARIRNFYAQISPEVRGYLIHSIHDDRLEVLHNLTIARSRLQPFVTAAGTVALINSIVIGAWLSLLLQFAFTPPVWLAALLGAFLFFVSVAAHIFYQNRRWEDFEANLDAPKFPVPVEVER